MIFQVLPFMSTLDYNGEILEMESQRKNKAKADDKRLKDIMLLESKLAELKSGLEITMTSTKQYVEICVDSSDDDDVEFVSEDTSAIICLDSSGDDDDVQIVSIETSTSPKRSRKKSEKEKEAAPDVCMELMHKIDILNVNDMEINEADEKNRLEIVTGEESIKNNMNISSNRNLEVQNEIILASNENNEHSKLKCDEILDIDVNSIYDGDELIGKQKAKPREPTSNVDEPDIVFEIPSSHSKNSEAIIDIQTAAHNSKPKSQSNQTSKEFLEKVGTATGEKNQIQQEIDKYKDNEIPNSANKEDSSTRTVERLFNTECDNISHLTYNWERKSLDELQKLRMNLESKMGLNHNDILPSVNSGELEDTIDLSDQLLSCLPEPEHVQMAAPIHHFGEISHPVMTPQPVAPPDMGKWPQFQNIPYWSSNIQNSSQLSQYLGLPQGIKPNNSRLDNRLRLQYDKTTEQQRLQIPTSRIPQLPYDVFGPKEDALQHEIRSACLQQIDSPTFSKHPQNTLQTDSNFGLSLSKSSQVRTYAEYRKLKMEEAAQASKRKQPTILGANKALKSQNIEKSKVTKKRKLKALKLINTDVSDGTENTGNLSRSKSSEDQIKHQDAKRQRIIRRSSDENQEHDDVRSVICEIRKSQNNKTSHPLKLRKVSTEHDATDRRGSKSDDQESENKQSMFIGDDVWNAEGPRFCGIISEPRAGNQMNIEKGNNRRKEKEHSATSVTNILPDTENINLPHQGDQHDLLQIIKEIPFVQKRRQPKSTKKARIFNINPEHNIRSKYMKQCILCPKTSENIVDHYRNSHHENEVFISRLHSSDLDYITKCSLIATPIPGQKGYEGFCIFCSEDIQVRTFSSFNYHFSSHTGEFGYKCRKCFLEKPLYKKIVEHCAEQCKKRGKNDAQWKKLYSYHKDISKINAFICNKCNYIQLHRTHLKRHLKFHHDIEESTDSDIGIITLIRKLETDEESSVITVMSNRPVFSLKTDEIEMPYDSGRNVSQTDVAEEAISVKTEIELSIESLNQADVLTDETMDNNYSKQTWANVSKSNSVLSTVSSNTEGYSETKDN